jgi:drug/metabolite transporter (DMT)-like permease
MERLYQALVIGAAGLSVALGDVLIKRAAIGKPRVADALLHPLMALALVLYTVQVVLFAYVFVRKWQLGIVALLQMAVYAIACILIARIWFGEQLTSRQVLGMLLAFCGAILMTR